MYNIKILFFIFILTMLSCNKRKTKEVDNSIKSGIDNVLGKKLILPDSLYAYKPFNNYIVDSSAIFKSKFKIYSHVDTSCGTCISNIELWNNFALKLKQYKVPIILICSADDGFELFKFFCESGEIKSFTYPFFLDKKNEYVGLNKFMEENDAFKTVLTDEDNTIILMGSPVLSKGMEELYINEIQKNKKN